MTDRDTYEIIVDIDGWPASRAALSQVVAAVLGVPPHRIRPVLDVRDEPVASYAHQEEADRVGEELATRGIDVVVRRRLRKRKTLRELTRRVEPSVPRPQVLKELEPSAPPEPVSEPEASPPSGTMKPGWLALDESGPIEPSDGGTSVGLPAWSDPAEPTTAPPRASQNALDPKAVSALLEAAATADTMDPGAQAGVWGDILGSALADRLVGAHEAASVATSAASPAHGSLEATGATPLASRLPWAGEETRPPREDIPPTQETLSPVVGGTTKHPGDLRSLLTSDASPVPDAQPPKSAWAVAGVDVAAEVVNAPKGVLRPVAPIEQPLGDPDGLFAGGRAAFAGIEEAALTEAEQQVPDDLTVGDKFVRLRQPSADELAGTPDPAAVLAWGLVAPGAGFAALGEPSRGFNYLLGAVLVFPWLKGALDASKVANEVRDGNALLQRKPDPMVLFFYVAGFWGFVACVAMAAAAVLSPEDGPRPDGEVLVEIDTRSQTSLVEPDSATEHVEPDAATVEPEIDERERQRQLNVLIREARLACEEERYAECERLAGHALDLDGRNRQALILQVEAVSRGVRSVPERSPETEHDRQPDRPIP